MRTVGDPASREPARTVWWARFLTRPYQFLLDIGVLGAAFFTSYLLRFELDVPVNFQRNALVQLPFVLLVQFGALFAAGVYAFVWRYVGLRELRAFLRAAAWSLAPLLLVRLLGQDSHLAWRIPLSIIVLDTVLGMGSVLGLRVLRRALYERYERHRGLHGNVDGGARKLVLLVGAGRAGVMAARELLGRGDAGVELCGFIDDDINKQGLIIHGLKVLGTTKDLPRLVRSLDVDHVIITIASAAREDIRRIARVCEEIPVRMRIIPGLFELLQGKVAVSRLRDVQIEDLLGRSPVQLDTSVVGPFLEGRLVMVTGAGGSIGAE
ncbi:MAG: nucleoside-diphosphate sugar epimerase/dehydratase, partial [Myxococcota bacterium]